MLEYNKPDLVMVHMVYHIRYIVHVTCPFDVGIIEKEGAKIDKHNPVKYERIRLWKMKVIAGTIIVGSLGIILKGIKGNIKEIGIDLLQKVCLLGTA